MSITITNIRMRDYERGVLRQTTLREQQLLRNKIRELIDDWSGSATVIIK